MRTDKQTDKQTNMELFYHSFGVIGFANAQPTSISDTNHNMITMWMLIVNTTLVVWLSNIHTQLVADDGIAQSFWRLSGAWLCQVKSNRARNSVTVQCSYRPSERTIRSDERMGWSSKKKTHSMSDTPQVSKTTLLPNLSPLQTPRLLFLLLSWITP